MKDGPIDNYLDKLFVELRHSSPRDARSMLNEAEDHLRDSADEAGRAGKSPEEGEAEAVRLFGEARFVAVADSTRGRWWLARRRLCIGLVLGGMGCLRGRGERPGRRTDAARGRLQPVLGGALVHVGDQRF